MTYTTTFRLKKSGTYDENPNVVRCEIYYLTYFHMKSSVRIYLNEFQGTIWLEKEVRFNILNQPPR